MLFLVFPAEAGVKLYPYGDDAGDNKLECDGRKICSTGFAPTAPLHIFKQTFTKINVSPLFNYYTCIHA